VDKREEGELSLQIFRGDRMKDTNRKDLSVGDLVKWKYNSRYVEWKQIGIILRCIPGTDRRKVVHWSDGTAGSYPQYQLEIAK
jgi:hypothetical protein